MKHYKTILFFLLIGALNTLEINAQHSSMYQVICEIDREGKVLSGSLEELIGYVQNGNAVRVGWVIGEGKEHEMWHWTDASFITVLKGHVFAQIKGIFAQATDPVSETPSVFLHSDQSNSWVAIFGTTGVMRQKFAADPSLIEAYKGMGLTDEQIQEQLKKEETKRFHTKWAVQVRN